MFFQSMGQQFIRFVKGDSVKTALRYTAGAIIPLLVMMWLGNENLGVELMLGTILVSGADIKEPLKDKVNTFLITGLLSFTLTILVCLIAQQYWVLIPILFVIIFLLSYVAPFGSRYGSIAVMGNLAIIISLSTYKLYQDVPAIMNHAVTILAGSVWYMVYALVIHYFTAKWQLIQLIATGMKQTAAYLQQRVSMFKEEEPLWQGLLALSGRQAELTNTHGEIREFLFQSISPLHRSGSIQRKMLLVFAELVEMLEAALATPLDYRQWRLWLKNYPELHIIPEVSQLEIKELERLVKILTHDKKAHSYQEDILHKMEEAKAVLENVHCKAQEEPEKEKVYNQALQVSLYQEVQLKKLRSMEGILQGELNQTENTLDETAYHRFANARIITWNSIKGNFTFQSSYLRYALRTSVTAVAGFMLGTFLGLENAYWVLLTILVVMKPGYAVTRQRFIHRIIGTVGGATIAYGLNLLEPSHGISLAIFGMALFLAFSFLPYIYAVSTIFFTVYVVFLYSFLHREIETMVIYRVVDTGVGAVLCFVALHYLWPSWEHQSFPYYLRKSMEANLALFFRITRQVYDKGLTMTEYRLARKNAYITMANLVSSYQRFQTEPKKKQKMATAYGDILLLNYVILGAISTIGVYIHRHPSLLQELACLKDKFYGIYAELEIVLANISQKPGAYLSAEAPHIKSEWKHLLQAWVNEQEDKVPVVPRDTAVGFISEQLEQLYNLVLRLKEQVQKESSDSVTAPEETVFYKG